MTNVNEGSFEIDMEYVGAWRADFELFTAIEELERLASDKPLSFFASLWLTVPRLHVELGGSEDSDFLTPYEDKGQVLLDTKITLVSGATQQIGWWPKNGLAEAKPMGFIRSFDVSKISSFFQPNVTHVSSWLSNAECWAIDAAKFSFTESNAGRNVAPAPSLDPAYWPTAEPDPLRVSLSAEE